MTKLTGRKFCGEHQFTTGGPDVVIGDQSGLIGYIGIIPAIRVS